MIHFRKNEEPNIELYSERLNRSGEIFMSLDHVKAYSNTQSNTARTLSRLCHRYMNINSMTGYIALDKHSVIDYLQQTEYVSSDRFEKKGVQSLSLDKDKVVRPLYESGIAQDFLGMYMQLQESNTRSNNMSKLVSRVGTNTKVEGNAGELTSVPFEANQTLNLRFNYSKEAIIGFPKEMTDVIYAPKDYCLAWGDFSQIDARVTYNILLKDDTNFEYIKAFPDIYAGFANWVNEENRKNLEIEKSRLEAIIADEELRFGSAPSYNLLAGVITKLENWKPFTGFKDKEARKLYKVYCLQTIYGTRYHKVPEANAFIKMFGKVLASCPKYQRYWDDVMRRVDLGVPLKVSCYFGHSELVPATGGRFKMDTLYKCLNYPVQGTSSEILILTCSNILEKLYAKGYTEEQVSIYYVRHDEPIFLIHKDVMKDTQIFKEFENLYIEDWLPLNLTFSFGECYGKPDPSLTEQFEAACSSISSEQLNAVPTVTTSELSNHYPLDDILELGIAVSRDADNIVTCFYDKTSHSFDTCVKQFSGVITDLEIIKSYVEHYIVGVKTRGFRQVVIYNLCDHFEDTVIDGIAVFFRCNANPAVTDARMLTDVVIDKLNNVSFEVTEERAGFLKSLSRLNVFGVSNEIT